MMKYMPGPRLLLPLAIFLGVTVMGLRVVDMVDLAASGRLIGAQAQAASKEADKHETPQSKPADTHAAEPKAAEKTAEKPAEPTAELEFDDDASPAEREVLKQLAGRREQLDKRSRDLDSREMLVKVTEQRVEQKIKELETLRQQLQSMVNNANEAQQAQLENLVKIYETMKPDEAAKIFETLEMPVLLGVIQKMKPARTAPIMARMAPEKAREVTVALTKQDQLPQVK